LSVLNLLSVPLLRVIPALGLSGKWFDASSSAGWTSLGFPRFYFLNKFSKACLASAGRAENGVEVCFSTLTLIE
jgi:hypothetical protein